MSVAREIGEVSAWESEVVLPPLWAEFSAAATSATFWFLALTAFPTTQEARELFSGAIASASREAVILAPAMIVGIGSAVSVWMAGTASLGLGHPLILMVRWTQRHVSTPRAIYALIAQIMGAVVGALAVRALFSEELILRPGGWLAPAATLNTGQGVFFEFILAAILVSLVLRASHRIHPSARDHDPERSVVRWALLLGASTALFSIAGRYLTGGVANPVLALASTLATSEPVPFMVYIVGPILGGTAAVLFTLLVRLAEARKPKTARRGDRGQRFAGESAPLVR